MKLFLPLGLVLVLFFSACDDNDDQVKAVNKDGGIEVTLSTSHIDSLKDLLTTHYTVWHQGAKVREFNKTDTVPSLGSIHTDGENDNGDTQDIKVKRDYEFYVTVK
jgi:hypothetical protein